MKLVLLMITLTLLQGCTTSLETDDSSFGERRQLACVVLLHGLGRTPRSMEKLADSLAGSGYVVVNNGYPSREAGIEALAEMNIPPALEQCRNQDAERINFVTHSLGGILVRYYLSVNEIEQLGRVVMLSPPNQGSEVADNFRGFPGVARILGPAFLQLGTGESSLPLQLGAANFEVGIIVGDNFGLWSVMLPDEDDGTVTVASSRLDGMTDFLVVDDWHTFIMNNDVVIRQVIFFLEHGYFDE